VKFGWCGPRITSCREDSQRRASKNIICTPTSRSPARLVGYYFSGQYPPRILSCPLAGPDISDFFFGGDECTGGYELAAGVGACGGQPGSSGRARLSHAFDKPCESRVSPVGETRSYACRRRVAVGGATRSPRGGGLKDRPPPEKLSTEGF